MPPVVCVAGKNQIACDVLARATEVPGLDLVALPNGSDSGEDGWQPSFKKAADRLAVPIVALESLYQQEDLVFLSLEFDRIVRPGEFASDRLFNLHFSLLPRFRGCNTAIWPILNGETEHGVTLHWIDEGVDTGPIIDQRGFTIADQTSRDLYLRCMELGTSLALEWLPRLVSGHVPRIPQDERQASTYRRRDLDMSLKEIDLHENVEQVLRRIRAFSFPEYQLPTIRGRDILEARPVDARQAPAGTVETVDSRTIIAWAADGALMVSSAPDAQP